MADSGLLEVGLSSEQLPCDHLHFQNVEATIVVLEELMKIERHVFEDERQADQC